MEPTYQPKEYIKYFAAVREHHPIIVSICPEQAGTAVFLNSQFADRDGRIHSLSYQDLGEQDIHRNIDDRINDRDTAATNIARLVVEQGDL